MIKKTLTIALLILGNLSPLAITTPVHAQSTALVGNVFVNSDPRLIRPSGFQLLSILGGGCGIDYGYGLANGCGGLGLGYGSPLYNSCGTTLFGAPAIFASPCATSACTIPVVPLADCPLLWR